jgi:serine protease Do
MKPQQSWGSGSYSVQAVRGYDVELSTNRLRAVLLAFTLAPAAQLLAVPSSAPRGTHSASAKTPGYLGVGFHDNSGHGVEVVLVDHDGPAGKVGLRPHDIIVSMNGQATNSASALSQMIHEASPGLKVLLLVQRDGQSMKMNIVIADRSEVERLVRAHVAADVAATEADPPIAEFTDNSNAEPGPPSGGANKSFVKSMLHIAPFTGLGLQTMEPQLADYFGASQGFGLLVQMVMPNSPAAFSGLRAGDVLLRADNIPIKTASDWSKRLRANQGQPMSLTILRDKREITLNLTPESRHHSTLEWPKSFQTQFFQTLR